MDKVGRGYWNNNWEMVPNSVFEPQQTRTRYYRNHDLAEVLKRTLAGLPPASSMVLEAGCADSAILPYVSGELGYRIAGIDYRPNGARNSAINSNE